MRILYIYLCLSIVGLVTASPPANALLGGAKCDKCVVSAIKEHKQEMINQFSQLKEHLTKLVKSLRQSIAQVEKDSLRVQGDIDFMLPSGGCSTGTAASAAGGARDRVESYLRAFNHLQRDEQDGTAAAVAMYDHQVEHYCAPEDEGIRGCTEASDRPNAQFMLETLLNGSGIGNDVTPQELNSYQPEILSFDNQRITDARRYIENTIDPYPLGDIPPDLHNTPQGRALWIRQKLYESELDTARHSMNHALALRVPSAALRGWLEEVWQESKSDEHLEALLAELPDNISYLELLKTEVDRRYASPQWYAGISANPPAAVLRELAFMQVFQLNMDYLRLRQGERVEMLLAQLVTADADTKRDELQAERSAAEQLVKPTNTAPAGDSSDEETP